MEIGHQWKSQKRGRMTFPQFWEEFGSFLSHWNMIPSAPLAGYRLAIVVGLTFDRTECRQSFKNRMEATLMFWPHLPFLDLAANELPPLLNDVNEDIALLHELTLLTGRVHLGINLQTAERINMASIGTCGIVSGFSSCWRRERMSCSSVSFPHPEANTGGRWSMFSHFISQWFGSSDWDQ